MLQIGLAFLHLIALAIGLPAIIDRALALGRAAREATRGAALERAFGADTRWGLSAMLWIGTGLWRYLAGTEMSSGYYNRNHFFLAKMTLLVAILLLEIWPMVTLIRWRMAVRAGGAAEVVARPETARRIASVSYVQCALLLLMVVFAVGMARGFGATSAG